MSQSPATKSKVAKQQHPQGANGPPPADQERYSRRLSDKIQAAFDHACAEGELAVAADLLETLELVLLRVAPKPDRREAIVAPLMASHERLWHLRATEHAKAKQETDPPQS